MEVDARADQPQTRVGRADCTSQGPHTASRREEPRAAGGAAAKGKGPEPPDTPHLGGVGILNDAQITRARQLQAAGQGVAGFTRSKHSVKNLNLPLN